MQPNDADKPEDTLRDEYRKIAKLGVRLSLVLTEIGNANGVGVTDQQMDNA